MGCSQSKKSLVAVEKAPQNQQLSKETENGAGKEQTQELLEHMDVSSSSSTALSRQENMKKWKKDLAKSGDMAKAIVNIEVSSLQYRTVRRVVLCCVIDAWHAMLCASFFVEGRLSR